MYFSCFLQLTQFSNQVRFPDRVNGKTGFNLIGKADESSTEMVTNKGTGAGMYGCGTRQKLSFSLGKYTTVSLDNKYSSFYR